MASLLIHRAPRAFALGLGVSSIFTAQAVYRARSRPLLCETIGQQASGTFRTYQQEAKVPVLTNDGKVNRAIFKQISSGSILGLIGGIAVSTFSKPLTFFIGILIAGVQYLESMGIHIVPTSGIQQYVKSIDVRSAVQDNVAFKICFGTTFALAAFAEL